MGGDTGPSVIVPAALESLARDPSLELILVGDETRLTEDLAAANGRCSGRLRIRHASEQVEMHEAPSKALRYKKDSSMRVAIDLIKAGEAEACVSAGTPVR
jgi:glycerol-3-phosphate acyltransferase PlsX